MVQNRMITRIITVSLAVVSSASFLELYEAQLTFNEQQFCIVFPTRRRPSLGTCDKYLQN